jgi:hypothetical protein
MELHSVARFTGYFPVLHTCSWGSASLHPRAGSPTEQLGWGARLYAVACFAGSEIREPSNLNPLI